MNLGVRLADTDRATSIKIIGKKQAQDEIQERKKKQDEAAAKKAAAKAKAAAAAAKKEAQRKISPVDMFKTEEYKGKFTQFDEAGLPTHESCVKSEEFADGEKPISK